MEQFSSVLRVIGCLFNFDRTFFKQAVETLIWVCTVCLCPTKRTLGLYWLNRIKTKIKDLYPCPSMWDTDRIVRPSRGSPFDIRVDLIYLSAPHTSRESQFGTWCVRHYKRWRHFDIKLDASQGKSQPEGSGKVFQWETIQTRFPYGKS